MSDSRPSPPVGSVEIPCCIRLKAGVAVVTCNVPRSLPISCVDVDCQPTHIIIDTTKFKRKPIYIRKEIPHNARVIPETAQARVDGNRLTIEVEISQTEEQKKVREELREKRANEKKRKRVQKGMQRQERLKRERELEEQAEAEAHARAKKAKQNEKKKAKSKRKDKEGKSSANPEVDSLRILEEVASEHDKKTNKKVQKELETAEWARVKAALAKKKKTENKQKRQQMAAKVQNEELVTRVLKGK